MSIVYNNMDFLSLYTSVCSFSQCLRVCLCVCDCGKVGCTVNPLCLSVFPLISERVNVSTSVLQWTVRLVINTKSNEGRKNNTSTKSGHQTCSLLTEKNGFTNTSVFMCIHYLYFCSVLVDGAKTRAGTKKYGI